MLTAKEASVELGVTQRVAQQMTADGLLTAVGVVGGTKLIDRASVRAARRSRGKGRRWEGRVLRSALAILDGRNGDVEVSSSEKSRLRAQLRRLSTQELAYRSATRGKRRRMSQRSGSRIDLAGMMMLTGASALTQESTAEAFDLTAGESWMLTGYVTSLDQLGSFALEDDEKGDVAVLVSEQELPAQSMALIALDLYAWGDARESSAGQTWIENRLAEL